MYHYICDGYAHWDVLKLKSLGALVADVKATWREADIISGEQVTDSEDDGVGEESELSNPVPEGVDPESMPEVALRQIWHAADISKLTRIRLATVGVRTFDLFSNLAQFAEAVVVAIAVVIGGDELFGTGDEQIMTKTRIASAWNKAKNHVTHNDSLRARLQDDPRRIPEMHHIVYKLCLGDNCDVFYLFPERQ